MVSDFPRVLGVVGARADSKSIPRKNIRPLLGKPLLAWIIEAARASQYVTRLIVSTDSLEYAEVAKKYGAEVPFLRPRELAKDHVPDFDYLYHAATWVRDNENWQPDIILRLPPTTPLCRTEHIDECVKLLVKDQEADSSRTITKVSKHPYKLWKINTAGYIEPFLSEEYTGFRDAHNMPRQTFPRAYQHVDVIALRWKTLVEDKSMAGKRVRYHEIPKEDAIDIDSEIDFMVAEELLKRRLSSDTNLRIHSNLQKSPTEVIYPELSYTLTGIFYSIHNKLGRFCREKQYADEFERMLKDGGIAFQREHRLNRLDNEVGGNIADFCIADKVLIDFKAKKFITKEDYFQMKRYLESSGLKLGMIVNFRNTYLKPKRIVNIRD